MVFCGQHLPGERGCVSAPSPPGANAGSRDILCQGSGGWPGLSLRSPGRAPRPRTLPRGFTGATGGLSARAIGVSTGSQAARGTPAPATHLPTPCTGWHWHLPIRAGSGDLLCERGGPVGPWAGPGSAWPTACKLAGFRRWCDGGAVGLAGFSRLRCLPPASAGGTRPSPSLCQPASAGFCVYRRLQPGVGVGLAPLNPSEARPDPRAKGQRRKGEGSHFLPPFAFGSRVRSRGVAFG